MCKLKKCICGSSKFIINVDDVKCQNCGKSITENVKDK